MLTATEFEITLGREAPPFVLLHCSWGGLAFWSVDRTAADFRRCESALRELHANGLTDLSVPSVGADDENGLTAASLQVRSPLFGQLHMSTRALSTAGAPPTCDL